jgi:hypothetical protein
MPYFSIGPPMPGLWGPPPMMYLPCPPGAGWYGPWTPPPIHFHPGWSGPAEGFDHGGYYTGDDRYWSVGHQQDRKASRQENRIVRNVKPDHPVSQRQQQPLVSTTSSGFSKPYLLLMDQGAIKIKYGRGARLRPMMKQSITWRKVQRRLQRSRTRLR